MQLQFATFDPRPADKVPAAAEANDAIFASGPVLGVEVTVPALAERCVLGNIDPQHSGGDADTAAIELAVTCKLPPEGAVLATVRVDLDSVGAMAVIAMRAEGQDLSTAKERVALVAESDKFARGGWPGARPLPTTENPWPEEQGSVESSRPLAAIEAAVMDFKVPLADRVATMEKWLLTGEEPTKQYRDSVEKERLDMIRALEQGEIRVETAADGRIAVVVSAHRAATSVGYSLAPVVVALNPEFRFKGGEPHRKFTVAQFEPKYVDLRAVFAELSEFEAGWGGSPTIGGSPQGISSTLMIEKVVGVVSRHLR